MPCCPAPMSYSMFITCALLEQINDDDDGDFTDAEKEIMIKSMTNN